MITYTIKYILSFESEVSEPINSEVIDVINSKLIRDYETYKPTRQKSNFLFRNVEISDQEIIKKINGLLNKITEKNFEKLFDKINAILKNDKIIDNMIDKLFDKAIIQTSFCKIYAQFCAKFCNNTDEKFLSCSIKESLMRKCDEMYKECLKEDDYEKVDVHNYEKFCAYMKNKKKLIGIFQFMGHLHKQKLATDNDISNYIKLLMKKIKIYKKMREIEQEQIELLENLCECLCKLLLTVSDSINIFKSLYIEDIKIFMTDTNNFSARIRFMFMDLVDFFNKIEEPPKYVPKVKIKNKDSTFLSTKSSGNIDKTDNKISRNREQNSNYRKKQGYKYDKRKRFSNKSNRKNGYDKKDNKTKSYNNREYNQKEVNKPQDVNRLDNKKKYNNREYNQKEVNKLQDVNRLDNKKKYNKRNNRYSSNNYRKRRDNIDNNNKRTHNHYHKKDHDNDKRVYNHYHKKDHDNDKRTHNHYHKKDHDNDKLNVKQPNEELKNKRFDILGDN